MPWSGTAHWLGPRTSIFETTTVPLPRNSSSASDSLSFSMASAALLALYAALSPRSGALPCAEVPRMTACISMRPLWPR